MLGVKLILTSVSGWISYRQVVCVDLVPVILFCRGLILARLFWVHLIPTMIFCWYFGL